MSEIAEFPEVATLGISKEEGSELEGLVVRVEGEVDAIRKRTGRPYASVAKGRRAVRLMDVIKLRQLCLVDRRHPSPRLDQEENSVIGHRQFVRADRIRARELDAVAYEHTRETTLTRVANPVAIVVVEHHPPRGRSERRGDRRCMNSKE